MGFDIDAFTGALWTLSKAFDKAAETTGIPREALALALYRHATNRKDKEGARLWKSAQSNDGLNKWIYRQARNFDTFNEGEMLKLAKEIPARIRRNLIEIAKLIPAPQGGKAPALDIFERWEVRKQVKALHEKGLSNDKAYQRVAKRMHVSAHTVRRACDKRERERIRLASRTIAFGIH